MNSKSLNNFDLLRLFAAVQVMLGHGINQFHAESLGWLEYFLEYFPGVPIFFIISGYLIGGAFSRKRTLKEFYINRTLRIFPGLYASIILSIIIIFIFGINVGVWDFSLWLFSQLFMLQSYDPVFFNDFGVGKMNPPLWTIAVEVQFYLLVPILFLFFKRSISFIVWVLVALILAKEANNFMHANDYFIGKIYNLTAMPHIYLFFIGAYLSTRKDIVEKYFMGKFHYWLGVYLTSLLLGSFFNIETQSNWQAAFLSILLGFLALSFAYSGANFLTKFSPKNDLSYGVYIYHYILINVIYEMGYDGWQGVVFLSIATFFIALTSWKFIELPFINMKRKVRSE